LVSTLTTTSSSVTSLDFSENGYHLASSNVDGQVIVHDIRKIGSDKSVIARLNKNEPLDSHPFTTVNVVAFDPCGKFLAYGGDHGLVIVAVKEWDRILSRMDVEKGKPISALAWSEDAKGLVSVSAKERITRFWGVKESE